MCHEITQVEFEFGSGRIISAELCPLDLEKFHYFSLSAHYLHHKLIFWINIRYINVSRDNAGWFRIWVRSISFRHSYAPWIRKTPVMGHKNTQIRYRYGSIWIIFSNVMHFALMYRGVRQFLTSPIFFEVPTGASVPHRHISSSLKI